jgi:hypothetical protein
METTTRHQEDTMKANIQTCDTITLDAIARVAVTGYTLDEIEAARERMAQIDFYNAMELRAGTQ